MIVSIQQPHYFPWIGYFEQIANSDHFVFLDTVQWIKQGRQHRTKIFPPISKKTNHFFLTIPVQSKGHRSKSFYEIKIDQSQNWQKQHWNTIQAIYGKSPCFRSQLEPIYKKFLKNISAKSYLIDICVESIYALWDSLQLNSSIHFSSDFECVQPLSTIDKNQRLVDLCQKLSANTYYSTIGSARYMNVELFRKNGIRVQQQNLRHPDILSRQVDISILDWIAHKEFSEIISMLNFRKCFFEQSKDSQLHYE